MSYLQTIQLLFKTKIGRVLNGFGKYITAEDQNCFSSEEDKLAVTKKINEIVSSWRKVDNATSDEMKESTKNRLLMESTVSNKKNDETLFMKQFIALNIKGETKDMYDELVMVLDLNDLLFHNSDVEE